MDADFKKIKKLVRLMQKEGVLNLKIPNLELSLSQDAVLRFEPTEKKAHSRDEAPQENKAEPEYTPEDILLWSSQGFMESEPN